MEERFSYDASGQLFNTGEVNLRESVTNGLTNAASSAILGKKPFKSLKSAIGRNAGAGAVTAGIDYLAEWQRNRTEKKTQKQNNKYVSASKPMVWMLFFTHLYIRS